MKKQNGIILTIYRCYFKRYPFFESLAYLLKYKLIPFFSGNGGQLFRKPSWNNQTNCDAAITKIAIIADEMTAKNFLALQGVEIIELTPQDWRANLEYFKPQLLFCESAWHGRTGCWDYRIHRNKRLLFDNRSTLKKILKYCKFAGVPTVFWNKEDPTFFDDPVNSFSDTAKLFDYAFTTCEESINRYRDIGVNAGVMMFGFSPSMFNPIELIDGLGRAVFFGGWYSDQTQRCANMREVFSFVIENGLDLTIYDRYAGSPENENNRYPEEFQKYLRAPVPYECIREELSHFEYVVNVTTETESKTMFARRVFEAMACKRLIISNYSTGLHEIFQDGIWFVDRPFNMQTKDCIIQENYEKVCKKYTFSEQLSEALKAIGLTLKGDNSNYEEINRK